MHLHQRRTFSCLLLFVLIGVFFTAYAKQPKHTAPDTKGNDCCDVEANAMSNQHLDELIKRIGSDIEGKLGYWRFMIADQWITVVTDQNADRMRIIVPVAKLEVLDKEQLLRLMQANFDSALDARYAIANEIVWSAFIHPLASLQEKEFLSGVGQVINLAQSFGKSYSSGLLIFRGGDSEDIRQKELIESIIDKGLAI